MSQFVSGSVFMWSYRRVCEFGGYELAACPDTSQHLANSLALFFLESGDVKGRLIVKLKPVTERSIRMVNGRDRGPFSYTQLKIELGDRTQISDDGSSVYLKLPIPGVELLIDAFEAVKKGAHDFKPLDFESSDLRFWPYSVPG